MSKTLILNRYKKYVAFVKNLCNNNNVTIDDIEEHANDLYQRIVKGTDVVDQLAEDAIKGQNITKFIKAVELIERLYTEAVAKTVKALKQNNKADEVLEYYSKVLDKKLVIVPDDANLAEYRKKYGTVYTRRELKELSKLEEQLTPENLKRIHKLKEKFGASVLDIKVEDEHKA